MDNERKGKKIQEKNQTCEKKKKKGENHRSFERQKVDPVLAQNVSCL